MTKRVGIEINGVLRDTIGKFTELYEKHMIDKNHYESTDKTYQIEFSGDTEEILELNENTNDNKFEYKILSPVTSLDLENEFKEVESKEDNEIKISKYIKI